jgi:hypothetical protein
MKDGGASSGPKSGPDFSRVQGSIWRGRMKISAAFLVFTSRG